MAQAAMNNLLKRRMTASQQASELRTGDEAYEKLFREAPPPGEVQIRSLPLDKLVPFSTADIGFRPYTPTQLEAFAEQLKEEGLLVRIIVRPTAPQGSYERAVAARPPLYGLFHIFSTSAWHTSGPFVPIQSCRASRRSFRKRFSSASKSCCRVSGS